MYRCQRAELNHFGLGPLALKKKSQTKSSIAQLRCVEKLLQHQVRMSGYNCSFLTGPVWMARFSQEPADQSVVLGQRAVLSCVVFNYTGIVQWTKDGLALGIGHDLRGGKISI